MKLLIDCSNLYAGGGLQVAISFLDDLKNLQKEHDYHIVESKNFSNVVDKTNFPSNFKFYSLKQDEESSILKRRKSMKVLENNISPDVIFTVFGPSYHKSNVPKIVGFAWGYVIFPDSPFYNRLKWLDNLKYKLLNYFKVFFFNKNSDILVFETKYAQNFYQKNYTNKVKCICISNTLNNVFYNPNSSINQYNFGIEDDQTNVLFLTANYKHKNIEILPEVIDALSEKYNWKNFKFHISINEDEVAFSEKHKTYINFLGRVKGENLPSLYKQIDLVFMPSLLETFSTTYLEAMFMKKPIIASDMGFSRDICGNSAYFCNPIDSEEYAKAIFELASNENLRKDLIQKGTENLKRFGTSMDRTKSYLNILEQISKEKNANN